MKNTISKFTIPNTVIIVLFFIKLINPEFHDPDFYWHLRTGEYIVSHLTVPEIDPFAYTSTGKTWVAHEWLSEVIFFVVHQVSGLMGLRFLIAGISCATFVLIFRLSRRLVENETHALLICLAFFAPVLAYESPRPQIFTYLLLSFLLYVLLKYKYFKETKHFVTIPFLMPLWVNLHGGYAVGFAVLFIFLSTEWVKLILNKEKHAGEKKNLSRLTIAVAVSLLTSNVNPHFIKAWTYPLYLVSLKVAQGDTIAEWRSPDFHSIFYKYYLILVITYFLALTYSKKKPDITVLLLSLFFICASMVSQRHIPLTCISLAIFVSLLYQHLSIPSAWTTNLSKYKLTSKTATKQISNAKVALLNIFLIFASGSQVLYLDSQGKSERILNGMFPVAATNYVMNNHISGNMLNDYGYGGYLIYRLWPERKVFIDGRADMYGDAFVEDYLEIYNGGSKWKEKFEKFSIDYVICSKSAAIRQLLLAEGSFKEEYSDESHSVLVRSETRSQRSAADIITKNHLK